MLTIVGIGGMVIIKQQTRIRNLKESRLSLAARTLELSATNALLLSVEAARKDELVGLREQTAEVLRLRNQLTQAHQQLAAAEANNQRPRTERPEESAGYVTKDQLRFSGFDTPEGAFQSLNWAAANGDYTNWLAALSPAARQEELTNSRSFEEFQHSSGRTTGIEVLATKPIGSDRVELKVRLDTENTVSVLIFPMVAVGNQWRLGEDIHSYSQAWDNPGGAQ
jgi:hypothetical protein